MSRIVRRTAASALLLAAAGCSTTRTAAPPPIVHAAPPVVKVTPPPPPKPRTAVEMGVVAGPPVSSLAITAEGAQAALDSFRTSCRPLLRRRDASGLTQAADWKPACDAAAQPGVNAVSFFGLFFDTVVVGTGRAFATGYYEPEIEGSRTKQPGYEVPIYRRPPELVEIDPGALAGTPTGRKQRGRMQDGRFVPFYERAEIERGALDGKGLELAWAKDPYEVFFLQIQGSGRLRLPDGDVMRIGYDGQNGREYVGIGSVMRTRGLIGAGTEYDTSMQGMMKWMRAHPDEAPAVLDLNKSFVFFRELTGAGPIGALGVPVAGHVSVAADPMFTPLGAPLFLTMDRDDASGLWVAQDTGGAIKGDNRFDTFWGAGILARVTAGGMSARGQALILVPRGTLDRIAARRAAGVVAVGAAGGGAAARP